MLPAPGVGSDTHCSGMESAPWASVGATSATEISSAPNSPKRFTQSPVLEILDYLRRDRPQFTNLLVNWGTALPSLIFMEEVSKLFLLLVTRWTCWLDCSDLLYSFTFDACDCGLVQDLGGRLIALLDADL